MILDKVLNGKSKLNYRGMCEKSGSGGSNTIQQETVNIKEIEEVLLLGTQPNTTHVKVHTFRELAVSVNGTQPR